MTDQDELRDRIAGVLHDHFELEAIGPMGCRHEQGSDEEHVAQAIIDEFGLKAYDFTTYDGTTRTYVHGAIPEEPRP